MKRMVIAASKPEFEYTWYEANPGEWGYWPFDANEEDMIDVVGGSVYRRDIFETMFDEEWPSDDYEWAAVTEVNTDDWPVAFGDPEFFAVIGEAKRYIEDTVKDSRK